MEAADFGLETLNIKCSQVKKIGKKLSVSILSE
jgi:hypothetical protein